MKTPLKRKLALGVLTASVFLAATAAPALADPSEDQFKTVFKAAGERVIVMDSPNNLGWVCDQATESRYLAIGAREADSAPGQAIYDEGKAWMVIDNGGETEYGPVTDTGNRTLTQNWSSSHDVGITVSHNTNPGLFDGGHAQVKLQVSSAGNFRVRLAYSCANVFDPNWWTPIPY